MQREMLRSSECGVRRPAHSAAESVIKAFALRLSFASKPQSPRSPKGPSAGYCLTVAPSGPTRIFPTTSAVGCEVSGPAQCPPSRFSPRTQKSLRPPALAPVLISWGCLRDAPGNGGPGVLAGRSVSGCGWLSSWQMPERALGGRCFATSCGYKTCVDALIWHTDCSVRTASSCSARQGRRLVSAL